jgi:hypothetical protein
MYCKDSLKEIHKSFINKITTGEINSRKIAYSIFHKHKGNFFKKPHRLTDLCDYCEYGKKLKLEIKQEAIRNGYVINEENNIDLDNLISFYQQNQIMQKDSI